MQSDLRIKYFFNTVMLTTPTGLIVHETEVHVFTVRRLKAGHLEGPQAIKT